MNEKVAQVLQKGKEIAMPICLKCKSLALQGYAKGNEMMDKVSFLQKPLHKKIVWGALGVVLLWIVFPSGGSSSKGLRFRESDFKKESSADVKFYVKHGKDDGMKDVVPNLRHIPKSLSLDALCGSFNPGLEAERHKKGMAYLNDENGTFFCVVVHVGDGFVIADPDSKDMYGNYSGYIETNDEYVEGQRLKTGFYEFVGHKKVLLANGSSKRMHAFKQLDAESNKLAVDAVVYNGVAIEAAEQENGHRSVKRREHEQKIRDEAISKAFAHESKRIKIREFKDQLHLPKNLKDRADSFVVQKERLMRDDAIVTKVVWYGENWMPLENLVQCLAEGKWKEIVSHSGFSTDDCSPEEYSKRLVDHVQDGCRLVACSDGALGVRHHEYSFVSISSESDEIELARVDNLAGSSFLVVVKLCCDIYMVSKVDAEILVKEKSPKAFVSAFNEKYGK